MKKEVFRLEQVSLPPHLTDIHMHLYTGEVVALIRVNALGIDELLSIFQRNIPLHYGHVYCNDQLVNDYLSSNRKLNNVTVIERKSMLIETLTVEENLFIIRKNCRQHVIRYGLLSSQMQNLISSLGLHIENRTLVEDLSSYEKLVLQLLKAKLRRSTLVILKDISTFVSDRDLGRLKPILDIFTKEGMTFLYVCNHHQEAFAFANRCYLMREGRIIKHLLKDQMLESIINHYSYEFNESVEQGQRQDQYGKEHNSTVHLAIHDLRYESLEHLNLFVGKGETVVVLDTENLVLDTLFDLVSGKVVPQEGSVLLNGKKPSLRDRSLALVPSKPDTSLVFPQLSLLDNLLFTSDHKIHRLWLWPKRREALAHEMKDKFGTHLQYHEITEYDQAYRLRLVYQRLLLQKPSFLCAVQPFSSVDMYQRMELISYFDLFKKRGTSILILAVSLSDTLQIADRLVILKEGRVERELERSQFSQYRGIAGSIPLQSKE